MRGGINDVDRAVNYTDQSHNKGIAIFPRMIDGRDVALDRHHNVNNFIMTPDDIRVWRGATVIQEPKRP